MLEHMVQCRVSNDFLPDLPPGVAMPILEMSRICQFAPGRDWDARAYHLIGRTDLAAQADGKVRIARNRVKEVGTAARLWNHRADRMTTVA